MGTNIAQKVSYKGKILSTTPEFGRFDKTKQGKDAGTAQTCTDVFQSTIRPITKLGPEKETQDSEVVKSADTQGL
jgi:hypothetical protein